MNLPLEHVAEYDSIAEWCALRGIKGNVGDPLPANLNANGALVYISNDPEAFQEHVRRTAYALAMERGRNTLPAALATREGAPGCFIPPLRLPAP